MTKVLARDPARRCLREPEWPEADRALWLAALEPGDVLEPGGARARYAAISNRKVAQGYGRWLAWLRHRGELGATDVPAARLTRAAVGAYLRDLARVNGTHTQLARLAELYEAAQVMGPGQDWQWIRRVAARVRAGHRPVRDKRPRMVGAEDLYALGCRLMEDASARGTPRQRAVRFRDGLAIALLAARPLRRRNLAALRIGRHLVRRGEAWWIQLAPAETKTRAPLEMPWPEALAPMLEAYLARHRPVLAASAGRWKGAVGDALWVSADGSPMTEMALYDRVVARTRAAFGRPVNPHLFRDCAATSVAIEDPAHIGIASPLLGHRNAGTAELHYNQARTVEAAARFQRALLELRDAGGAAPPHGGSEEPA